LKSKKGRRNPNDNLANFTLTRSLHYSDLAGTAEAWNEHASDFEKAAYNERSLWRMTNFQMQR